MITAERVSELQDMVLRGEDIDLQKLNPEEQHIVNSNQRYYDKLHNYFASIGKIMVGKKQ